MLCCRFQVVLGVHGGALTNTLFCRPGALLIELGFDLDMTRHYQHMAAALSLRYTQVLLQPDQRGVGAPVVSLSETAVEGLLDAVVGGLD